MKIYDMLVMCLRNLWRRKGRTMLTVVGVVIGSCAVIVMISLGLGMSAAMDAMLSSWGDLTAVTIYNAEGSRYSSNTSSSSSEKPKLDDKALELLKSIDHVEIAIPKVSLSSEMITVVSGRNDRYRVGYGNIYGIDFKYLKEMKFNIVEGELPTEEESNRRIIVGDDFLYEFQDTKKRGENAYVMKQQLPDGTYTKPFVDTVGGKIKVGINNRKKQSSDGSYQYGGKGYEFEFITAAMVSSETDWDISYSMFIDIDIAKQIISDYNRLNGIKKSEFQYSQIKLSVDDLANVDGVQAAVEALGFSAQSMSQIRNEMQGELGVIQLVLGGLAAISLLVAAISITNTMIMSIYERTREIGIMKVLGCFIGNIRMIFLMEAGLIGLLGGIIGTIISYTISFVMNTLLAGALGEMFGVGGDGGQVSIIPLWLVLLALVFSTIIGLISGYYPANRAVKISALEAIKNE